MTRNITLSLFMGLALFGCTSDRMSTVGMTTMGFKPIYASSGNLKDLIKSTAAKPLTETGKIYVKGNLLLVNRPYEGVHVIDNTDSKNPVNMAFLQIPGNVDVTIKGDYMYADYAGKICVIDIHDIAKPRVTQDVTLDTKYQQYPPQADITNSLSWRTYFECPDKKKGTVVGWVYTRLNSPKCWRDNP